MSFYIQQNGVPTTTIHGGWKRRKASAWKCTIRHTRDRRGVRQPGGISPDDLEGLLAPIGIFFNLLSEIGAPIYSGDMGGIGTALYEAVRARAGLPRMDEAEEE